MPPRKKPTTPKIRTPAGSRFVPPPAVARPPGPFGRGLTARPAVPPKTVAAFAATTPPNFVHLGGEVWQLPLVTYQFNLPPGVRLKRITGHVEIAPVPGCRPDSGLVRQVLVWVYPGNVPVGPPPGVKWVQRPDGLTVGAHGELDQHLVCHNCKVTDGVSGRQPVWQDFGEVGIEIPGGLIVMNVANQTGKADAGRTRWDNDLRPMSTPDAEVHLWFWW